MRTAMQNLTRRRQLDARARAVSDRNWHTVGWIDRQLHRAESDCPFALNATARDQWLAGFRDAAVCLQRRLSS